MDLGLAGTRALLGGASSGLGAAIATTLAGEGARVALVSRSADKLGATAGGLGEAAIPITADLATEDGPVSSSMPAGYEIGDTSNRVVRFIASTANRHHLWAGVRTT